MCNLREHNIPVFEELEKLLLEKRKAIVITGTGTGKSYLSLETLQNKFSKIGRLSSVHNNFTTLSFDQRQCN